MAYVRTHGNQLAIVHGERDPETQKVQQRILFTLYSKGEALAALGREGEGTWRLKRMLSRRYPEIRFDWARIQAGIQERMQALPDSYAYRTGQLLGRFRLNLVSLVQQLELADPQSMYSAAQLLSSQRIELEYLRELIDWRLRCCDQKENKWNTDNSFFWRHRMQDGEIPAEAMERIEGAWNRGELDRVAALAQLYIECFEGYADGHHYLGQVALERGDLEAASEQFREALVVGRKLFPKRLAKKHHWNRLETRPYMRALRSLTITLARMGSYDEALALCDRQEQECGDVASATTFRAAIFLNTGRWQAAREAALELVDLWPVHALFAGFASHELGERGECVVSFLHGMLNRPRSARILLGLPPAEPRGFEEVQDYNEGIEIRADLTAFLESQSNHARGFFRRILNHPRSLELVEEIDTLRERLRSAAADSPQHETFARIELMQSAEFARKVAEVFLG